jgi:hypothetical protein
MVRYVDPEKDGIHPLRHKLTEEEMDDILQGIADDKDWMSLEEIEAAHDYLFDAITIKMQTHPGEVILQ